MPISRLYEFYQAAFRENLYNILNGLQADCRLALFVFQ
jgi:hypothetical protein